MTSPPALSPRDTIRAARARTGRAIRRLGHAFVGHDQPADVLDEAVKRIDELTGRLDCAPPRQRSLVEDDTWHQEVDDGDVITSYDERPFSGQASPWGLDLTVVRDGDEVVAHTTLQAAHEGAPDRSHGGIVAGLFDDLYGFLLGMLREPAFTGELSVRYEAPTPLHVPLACRARLVERTGRKLYMTGELTAAEDPDGRVIARSKATMIAVNPDAFADGTQQLPPPADR